MNDTDYQKGEKCGQYFEPFDRHDCRAVEYPSLNITLVWRRSVKIQKMS